MFQRLTAFAVLPLLLVAGEIWQAMAAEHVEKGAQLRVTGHEAYLLRVERG